MSYAAEVVLHPSQITATSPRQQESQPPFQLSSPQILQGNYVVLSCSASHWQNPQMSVISILVASVNYLIEILASSLNPNLLQDQKVVIVSLTQPVKLPALWYIASCTIFGAYFSVHRFWYNCFLTDKGQHFWQWAFVTLWSNACNSSQHNLKKFMKIRSFQFWKVIHSEIKSLIRFHKAHR